MQQAYLLRGQAAVCKNMLMIIMFGRLSKIASMQEEG